MNIIFKLTLRHISINIKRTVVTILGIVMSTALIGAMFIGGFSFFSFFGILAERTDGKVQAAFYELSEEQAKILKEDPRIEYVGIRDMNPEISGVRLISDAEERFKTGNITYADEDYFNEMILCEYDGRFPENSNEIAVEEAFLKDNNLTLKVGDTLSFEQGYRFFIEDDKEESYLGGPYRSDEGFVLKEVKNCTITAVLHDNMPTKDYDILCGIDGGFFPESKYAEARICLKKRNHTSLKQIKSIREEANITKYELNTEYLLSVFAIDGSQGAFKALFVMMGIALLIIIVTSVVLIVNSIGMSLTERIRYLGMLSSVGATGRQKRFSIYFEGLILGLIGIPIGIFVGYLGTKITLLLLGGKMLEANLLAGSEGMQGGIPVNISPAVIFAIVLFSAVTIFVSVLVPAFKAARIMPIDALRQNGTIRIKPRHLRINPLIRLIFGYEGELAYKNIKRNGIKGTIITISIAASIILFLTISYFCDSLKKANSFDFNMPYQVLAGCSYKESEKMREDILKIDGVDEVFSAGMIQFSYKQNSDNSLTLANADIVNKDFLKPDYSDLEVDSICLVLVEDEDFDVLLEKNKLDVQKYHEGNLKGVLLNSLFHETNATEVFNEGILSQSLHYDVPEGFPPAVEIADFVKYDKNSYIFKLVPSGTIAVFVPVSEYYKAAKETISEDILTYDLAVVTDEHEKVVNDIYNLFEAEGYTDYSVSDVKSALLIMEAVTLTINTPMYGFMILLTLITIANIINTISTGVLLRRKEFAMYRSVGMDNRGFKKMMWLEIFLYGFRAIFIGVPVSILLSYLMYSAFSDKLYSFIINPVTYSVCIISVFLIVGAGMVLSINKIKEESIIEALKEDAI